MTFAICWVFDFKNQSINQSINRSIDRSINQSINQSVSQSIRHSVSLSLIELRRWGERELAVSVLSGVGVGVWSG